MKVTLPFFLSSKKGFNPSADGSAFDVHLEQPIVVPSGKRASVYVSSADVPYCQRNVSALKKNNTLILGCKYESKAL